MDLNKLLIPLIPGDDYIFGFAELSGLLNSKYSKFNYGISVIKRLDDKIIDSIISGPNSDYLDLYHKTNKALSNIVTNISDALNQNKIQNKMIQPTGPDMAQGDYLKTLRSDFSHKLVATRAGLGWIGKTDLFISKTLGPRVRLASVLVENGNMEVGKPIMKSRCGKCNLCVENCPANSSTGKLWTVDVDRDEFFNAHKCRDKCKELSKKNMNAKTGLCGICISICPIGCK